MLEEIFQKTAKLEREDELRRGGVLSARTFDDYSSLRAFLPSESLRQLVSHYWVVRWDIPKGITYKPTEVLSGPAVNIFFTPDEAFIYGLSTSAFDYIAESQGIMAGATFTYGGFYPFLGKSMAKLPKGKQELTTIIPKATAEFARKITNSKDDQVIASHIESLLLGSGAKPNRHLATLHNIVEAIHANPELRSPKAVSKHFRIPERTLQLLFEREVGISLKWTVMRARLLEAAVLAAETTKPNWAVIATDLGYSSQAHFISDFKRATGTTPASFYKTVA